MTLPAGTVIGSFAFNECSNLSTLTLTAGTSGTIGDSAFRNCYALETVTVPEGYTEIGSKAFEYCSALTTVGLPKSLTSFADNAFEGCTALASVTVAEGSTAFATDESGVLYDAGKTTVYFIPSNVTTFTIPATLTMADYDLEPLLIGISTLEKIEKEEGADYNVSYGVLYDEYWEISVLPKAMTAYTIPKEVTVIDASGAFAGSKITSVTFEEGGSEPLTIEGGYTDENAFDNAAITTVSLPGRAEIGDYAFASMTTLTSVTLAEGITSIGRDCFRNCTNLATVVLPEGFTTIGYYAFALCTSLTEIDLPESLVTIGNSAFDSCPITRLVIPASVKTVEGYAFYGWKAEQTIVMPFAEGFDPTSGTDGYSWQSNWTSGCSATIEYAAA